MVLKATNFNCYMSPMLKREVCGADASGGFKRSDFGMTNMVGPIGDEVNLMIGLEGAKK